VAGAAGDGQWPGAGIFHRCQHVSPRQVVAPRMIQPQRYRRCESLAFSARSIGAWKRTVRAVVERRRCVARTNTSSDPAPSCACCVTLAERFRLLLGWVLHRVEAMHQRSTEVHIRHCDVDRLVKREAIAAAFVALPSPAQARASTDFARAHATAHGQADLDRRTTARRGRDPHPGVVRALLPARHASVRQQAIESIGTYEWQTSPTDVEPGFAPGEHQCDY